MLLARAVETNSSVTIPSSARAQAIRRPERQARLSGLIRQPSSDVMPLDRVDAVHVGRLRGTSGTSDVVDAHVVVWSVLAGRPNGSSPPTPMTCLCAGSRPQADRDLS